MSISPVSVDKVSYYQNKISNLDTRKLSISFSSVLCPPAPTTTSSLTADDFASYFTDKVITITIHTQSQPPPAHFPPFTFHCLLRENNVSNVLDARHPITCPLDPDLSPYYMRSHRCCPLSHQQWKLSHTFNQIQVTPLLQKITLSPTAVENYRPVSLLPFLSKKPSKTVVFMLFSHRSTYLTKGFKSKHSADFLPCRGNFSAGNSKSKSCKL